MHHPSPQTLIAAIQTAAIQSPNRGIAIYDRRGLKAERHTYAEMLERFQFTAARLATAGIGPGDRVLICAPTNWDLLDVFFGTIFRGALPTLVAPPGGLGGASAHAKKVELLIELMGCKRIVCDEAARAEFIEFNATAAASLTLTAAELRALSPAPNIIPHSPAPNDIAIMQLTSGSTGRQRAVMISHSNVLSNTAAIADFVHAQAHTDKNHVVSWLPLNHDMGLIGCLFFAINNGLGFDLLRPETFLGRPRLWLQYLAKNPGTLSTAPNFAYQLCVERADPSELAGCNLANLTHALTGAEMIRPETCNAFSEKFASSGFNPKSFLPCYGMAEATLAVTADTRGEGMRTLATTQNNAFGLRELVSTGKPITGTTVRISPPSSEDALSEGAIGEVCARGPGIFSGYFRDDEATASALQSGWLRTGDLGFMKDGELYLTGRIKDVLIIHGHNIMPHEIEWLAESATGAGGAERSGAFSVAHDAGGEQAVVVLELQDTDPSKLAELEHDIRSRIGRSLGLPMADIVFIKRGQLPKTSSGKIQRGELRRRYMEGKLERLSPSI